MNIYFVFVYIFRVPYPGYRLSIQFDSVLTASVKARRRRISSTHTLKSLILVCIRYFGYRKWPIKTYVCTRMVQNLCFCNGTVPLSKSLITDQTVPLHVIAKVIILHTNNKRRITLHHISNIWRPD